MKKCYREERDESKGGRCITAVGDIPSQSVFLSEKPLVWMQCLGNSDRVNVCGCCGAFLGPLERYLQRLEDDLGDFEYDLCDDGDSFVDRASPRQDDSNRSVLDWKTILPFYDKFPNLPAPFKCNHLCGTAYCSEECKRLDWERFHQYFCLSLPEKHDDVVKFNDMVRGVDPQFMLGAKIVCLLLHLSATQSQSTSSSSEDESSNVAESERSNEINPLFALRKLLCRANWSDLTAKLCVYCESDEERSLLVRSLRDRARCAFSSICSLCGGTAVVERVCSFEDFDSFLGLIHLNSTECGVVSPLERYATSLLEFRGTKEFLNSMNSEISEMFEHAMNVVIPRLQESDTRLSAVGVFAQHSSLNHSCVPNAEFRTMGLKLSIFANVVSLVDIPKDNEICISYIPQTLWSVSERREYLKTNYGFVCRCELCNSESDGCDDDE